MGATTTRRCCAGTPGFNPPQALRFEDAGTAVDMWSAALCSLMLMGEIMAFRKFAEQGTWPMRLFETGRFLTQKSYRAGQRSGPTHAGRQSRHKERQKQQKSKTSDAVASRSFSVYSSTQRYKGHCVTPTPLIGIIGVLSLGLI